MLFENTLWATADDVQTRGFRDWLTAHTSFMKPLHRYRGSLRVDPRELRLAGEDKRNDDRRVTVAIPLDAIRDVAMGFDAVFGRMEDRQIGLFDFKPLRVVYRSPETGADETIYLFARFHHAGIGWRASDNREVLALLQGRAAS